MRRRSLMAVTFLIGLVMTAFVAGSALGEHPWESDWNGDYDDGDGGYNSVGDTTLLNRDTAFESPEDESSGGVSLTTLLGVVVNTVASIL